MGGFERICQALAEIALAHPDVEVVYPVHLNPNVSEPVQRILHGIDNIKLIQPQDYLPFVYLMNHAYLILTDSGGIQEEAPSLGKPVLVMRDTTERPEAVEAGSVRLVGTDTKRIVSEVTSLLTDENAYHQMSKAINPYGDGHACQRILEALKKSGDIMSFETISVIGLGYIGLPTAAAFASRKKSVIGIDVNQHAVDTINKGQIHIVEPDLDKVVKQAVEEGHLKAYTTPQPADAYLIAVPTPFKGEHEPDLAYVESAARSIAPVLKKGDLIILESTSPVGSTEQMAEWLAESRPDLTFPHQQGEDADIDIAYCPERVLPGQVMIELIRNDRVVGE